jgi:hypothetical protein
MGVESDGTFKLIDRRPFNADGTLREDMPVEAQAGRQEEAAAATQPAAAGPLPSKKSESADRLHPELPLESKAPRGKPASSVSS